MRLGKAIKYNILIEASGNNGFIATVGCGRFVFENPKGLIDALVDYLDNPEKMEKTYGECFGPPAPGQAMREEIRVDRPTTIGSEPQEAR
uniref:Uncharacterized protein n=1 Tax=viral metagenome TaxID=1070528 RepID=A0A6H1ZGX0_9ZZZZ